LVWTKVGGCTNFGWFFLSKKRISSLNFNAKMFFGRFFMHVFKFNFFKILYLALLVLVPYFKFKNLWVQFYKLSLIWKLNLGWKHIMENQKSFHILLFFQGYHVWTSTMWLLWTMVNIFAYYAKSNATRIIFFILCDMILKCICTKKMYIKKYFLIKKFNKWLK
jgi:hypothetical protein